MLTLPSPADDETKKEHFFPLSEGLAVLRYRVPVLQCYVLMRLYRGTTNFNHWHSNKKRGLCTIHVTRSNPCPQATLWMLKSY